MPTYEYACTACGGHYIRQHRMTDPSMTECPDCGGRVRKVFHAPGISVRGGSTCPAGLDAPGPSCAVGGG